MFLNSNKSLNAKLHVTSSHFISYLATLTKVTPYHIYKSKLPKKLGKMQLTYMPVPMERYAAGPCHCLNMTNNHDSQKISKLIG